ncbi:hypothetical protein T484DRAFT_1951641 [Baffinella frigidus]|nr:hypothetical protein T484DRAFT_1951641 [Cryptophyta sp. CCMP2293]
MSLLPPSTEVTERCASRYVAASSEPLAPPHPPQGALRSGSPTPADTVEITVRLHTQGILLHSASPVKLTCWGCGTNPSTLRGAHSGCSHTCIAAG